MTCVVGLVDQDGKVWLGADSAVTIGDALITSPDPKVFRLGSFLIGASGSCKYGATAHYWADPPPPPELKETKDLVKYMTREFVPQFRAKCEEAGVDPREPEGELLVGFDGHLFFIEQHWDVLLVDNFHAIGSGGSYAQGAMHVLRSKDPIKRIRRALEVAEACCSSVRRPWRIVSEDLERVLR